MSYPLIPIFLALWVIYIPLTTIIKYVNSPLRHLPGPPSVSLLKGNFGQLFNPLTGWDFICDLDRFRSTVVKLYGLFGKECVYVSDPKAVHHILLRDQYVYEETPQFIAVTSLLFGPGLLATQGHRHKQQRKMLNPVFSTKNVREMLPLFLDITEQLCEIISNQVEWGPLEIDMHTWLSRAALELIGQGGIGYSFNALSLDDSNSDPYKDSLKSLIPAGVKLAIIRRFLPWAMKWGTPKMRGRALGLIPYEPVQNVLKIVDTLHTTSLKIFEDKKAALISGDEAISKQVGHGKDIMSILLRENSLSMDGDHLLEPELLAQMNTLTFAGIDTSANSISRLLHVLALHPDAQRRLREEVTQTRMGGSELSYDTLIGLPWLDAVCRETLRLYPPIPFVTRAPTRDIVLPLSDPVCLVGSPAAVHELLIPKGTEVMVGIATINRSKALWGENAHEWEPERWLRPLPASLVNAHLPGVYSSSLTFLGGGRACIGFKFAQLEMKVVISKLIEKFAFEIPPDKTIRWNIGNVQWPTVEGEDTTSLPMVVSLVKRDAE